MTKNEQNIDNKQTLILPLDKDLPEIMEVLRNHLGIRNNADLVRACLKKCYHRAIKEKNELNL